MLPKHLRLSYQESVFLKKTGTHLRAGCIQLTFQKTPDTFWRFLIIIPKHVVKLATGRNRLKRIIRENIRLRALQTPGGGRMIIRLTRIKPEAEVLIDLENVLQKLH